MFRIPVLSICLVASAAGLMAESTPDAPADGAEATTTEAPAPSTMEEKAAYLTGLQLFAMSRQSGLSRFVAAVDTEWLHRGLDDAAAGKDPAVDLQQAREIMTQFQQQMQADAAKQGGVNRAAGEKYLAALKEQEGVQVTDSGLAYEVIKTGDGPKPTASDTVRVHYTGKLIDGKVFDSSHNRGEPTEFPLSNVIPGWTEGIQLMPVGSTFRFHIPADLAYGDQAPPSIGPGQVLIFDVDLLDIVEQ